MKIILDNELKLTGADYPEAPEKIQLENAKITHSPADLFQKFGFVVEANAVENKETAFASYHKIRNAILQNQEIQNIGDQKFLFAIKNHNANFASINLQKVTYEIERNDDIDKIAEQLENMSSNAIFRALSIDKENNRITTYSSREGVWDLNGLLTAKLSELRSKGKIRTDRAYRSVQDPTKKIDAKRANYGLLEETKALIESGAINNSYCTREQPDGSYKDDTAIVFITSMHFKDELSDEDIKDQEIKKETSKQIVQETTHVEKRQATKEQADESIANNDNEIHSKHDIVIENIKQDETIKEIKETAMQSYVDRMFANLEERHKREAEELKQKMQNAFGADRAKAHQTFLISLANGMTVSEAIDNLRSAKHNDLLIEIVLEDVKMDMILTKEKDELIDKTSKELDKTSKELESKTKILEQTEKANKTNHENYVLELNKRKEREIAIEKLKDLSERMKNDIVTHRAEIIDLKESISQKDSEISQKDNELEKQFDEISTLSNSVESLKESDALKTERLQKAEIEFAKIRAELAAKSEDVQSKNEQIEELKKANEILIEKLRVAENENAKIFGANEVLMQAKEELSSTNATKDATILDMTRNISELEMKYDRAMLVITKHKEAIKKITDENDLLKSEIFEIKKIKNDENSKAKDEQKQEAKESKSELSQKFDELMNIDINSFKIDEKLPGKLESNFDEERE